MNKHIDREKVYWMLRTGWHPERIAERLGCSRRQVDRIKKKNGWSRSGTLKVTEVDEYELWKYYRDLGESYQKIGLRFGVSRQAVHKKLTQEAEFVDIMDYGIRTMKSLTVRLEDGPEEFLKELKADPEIAKLGEFGHRKLRVKTKNKKNRQQPITSDQTLS